MILDAEIVVQLQETAFLVPRVVKNGGKCLRIQSPIRAFVAGSGEHRERAELTAIECAGAERLVSAVDDLRFSLPVGAGMASVQIDHRGQAFAVLGGQSTGDELHVFDELRRQKSTEKAAHRIWQGDAIELVLNVRVIAASKEIPKGVVDETGPGGQNLIDRGCVPARKGLNICAIKIGRRARRRRRSP